MVRRDRNGWAAPLVSGVITAIVAGGVAAAGRPAAAERLALVSSDLELERATVTVLAPWGVEVVAVTDQDLAQRMPLALDQVEGLARARAAGAVAWISAAPGEQATLWLYDAASGRAMTLRLPTAPPFDPPTAAGVALTLKTLLRYSQVAPTAERYAIPPPPPHRLGLEASAGVELRPAPAARSEARFGVTGLYRPWLGQSLAVALGVRAGPGFAIDSPDVVGRYRDTSISLGLRAAVSLGHHLRLIPAAGMSVHIDGLSVTVPSDQASASSDQLNPALDAGLGLEVEVLSHLRLSLMVGGDLRLRRQRFLVGDREVFDIPAFATQLGGALDVPFL